MYDVAAVEKMSNRISLSSLYSAHVQGMKTVRKSMLEGWVEESSSLVLSGVKIERKTGGAPSRWMLFVCCCCVGGWHQKDTKRFEAKSFIIVSVFFSNSTFRGETPPVPPTDSDRLTGISCIPTGTVGVYHRYDMTMCVCSAAVFVYGWI